MTCIYSVLTGSVSNFIKGVRLLLFMIQWSILLLTQLFLSAVVKLVELEVITTGNKEVLFWMQGG